MASLAITRTILCSSKKVKIIVRGQRDQFATTTTNHREATKRRCQEKNKKTHHTIYLRLWDPAVQLLCKCKMPNKRARGGTQCHSHQRKPITDTLKTLLTVHLLLDRDVLTISLFCVSYCIFK